MRYFKSTQSNRQRRTLVCYAFVCLAIAFFALIVGYTVARMVISKSDNSNSAIAGFVFVTQAEVANADLIIDCGSEKPYQDYKFTVSNTGNGKTADVNIEYKIIVVLPKVCPDEITLTMNGQAGISQDKITYTFLSPKSFTARKAETHEFILRFTADSEKIFEESVLNGITVSVDAQQTQNEGGSL